MRRRPVRRFAPGRALRGTGGADRAVRPYKGAAGPRSGKWKVESEEVLGRTRRWRKIAARADRVVRPYKCYIVP